MKKYSHWKKIVIMILKGYSLINNKTKLIPNFYKEYFDAGYSPMKAVKEDMDCMLPFYYDFGKLKK